MNPDEAGENGLQPVNESRLLPVELMGNTDSGFTGLSNQIQRPLTWSAEISLPSAPAVFYHGILSTKLSPWEQHLLTEA